MLHQSWVIAHAHVHTITRTPPHCVCAAPLGQVDVQGCLASAVKSKGASFAAKCCQSDPLVGALTRCSDWSVQEMGSTGWGR